MRTFKTLVDGLAFPEGPRWCQGRLFFSDMHAQKVMSASMDGVLDTVVEVPGLPSGIGFLPDGPMIVVSMRDRKLVKVDHGRLQPYADLSKLASFDCNDMVVDGRGRAYVGNFGYDLHHNAPQQPAELIMVNEKGDASVVARDLMFPNGTVIEPDGKTLIVGETMGRRLTAFDIYPDGTLHNRRVWAELGDAVPDGIALDADHAVWVASPLTKELIRVFEGGRIAEKIATEQMAIACTLGGANRKTLFLLSAASINPRECIENRRGRIDITEVEVAGAGWP